MQSLLVGPCFGITLFLFSVSAISNLVLEIEHSSRRNICDASMWGGVTINVRVYSRLRPGNRSPIPTSSCCDWSKHAPPLFVTSLKIGSYFVLIWNPEFLLIYCLLILMVSITTFSNLFFIIKKKTTTGDSGELMASQSTSSQNWPW